MVDFLYMFLFLLLISVNFPCSFTVESSNQRTLHLRAESKRVLDMWCRAIQMHTDIVKVLLIFVVAHSVFNESIYFTSPNVTFSLVKINREETEPL